VESLLIHARNLIEFFQTKKSCDCDPRWFTNVGYRLKKRFVRDTLLSGINQQIAHLTAKRTVVKGEKLSEVDWKEIVKAIETEIVRFQAALTPDYKAKYQYNKARADVSGIASSATNVIATTTFGPTAPPNS
jgi:hypothetical protein